MTEIDDQPSLTDHGRLQRFGLYVRGLREARKLTQEDLAERSGLAADTVRRLEHGSFNPSLKTLRKLCAGLELMLSTLFEGHELGESSKLAELMDLMSARSEADVELVTEAARRLLDDLDRQRGGDGPP